jgi:hypothetical protein
MMPIETGVARGSGEPPGTARSPYARRFLLSAASFLFILFLLEFLALIGVLDYRRIIGARPSDFFAATNIDDKELLHLYPPHSSFSGVERGGNIAALYRIPPSDMGLYQWDVRYDQNGFRNDLDPPQQQNSREECVHP